jgi:hypothetical protein
LAAEVDRRAAHGRAFTRMSRSPNSMRTFSATIGTLNSTRFCAL